MTYEVPESKRSLKQNQFLFKVPGNTKQFTVVKAKFLPVGLIETLSGNDKAVSIKDLLELFGGGEASEAVRGLDSEQLNDLMGAWQKDSGISVGESSASTDS